MGVITEKFKIGLKIIQLEFNSCILIDIWVIIGKNYEQFRRENFSRFY